jgi:hypothetical protein
VYLSTRKVPFFFYDFSETCIFSKKFRNIQIFNFMKIRIVGAELSHADGRTDMATLVISLRNFENTPKNEILGAGLKQVTCTFLN